MEIASADRLMHCKLRWNRHRRTRAHHKRRIADALQAAVRPSSQHAHIANAELAMLRRHGNMGAHCSRSVADASQTAVRPSSQHGRTADASQAAV